MQLLIRTFIFLFAISHVCSAFAETALPEQTQKIRAASKPQSPFRLQAFNSLVSSGRYELAYALAQDMIPYWEGDKRFDFSYGMAALETQNFDQALFAFERLLFQYPKEPRYRLELARTHFFLRNLDRAELEFNRVLANDPPAPVQANVQRFLDQIAILRRSVEPAFIVSIDLASGYDSNINSATADKELPKEELIFPVDITLSDESRETDSGYWSTQASLYYLTPLTKLSAMDVRFLANKRENFEVSTYNLDSLMLEAGYSLALAQFKWRAGGRSQHEQKDNTHLLSSQVALGQLQWRFKTDYSWGWAPPMATQNIQITPTLT